jgi:hypothetical protein
MKDRPDLEGNITLRKAVALAIVRKKKEQAAEIEVSSFLRMLKIS